MENYGRGRSMTEFEITEQTIARFHELTEKKKEVEEELNYLKRQFHQYFDDQVGVNRKGEITEGAYKLQRQIRKSVKFDEKTTVEKLEALQLNDLIKVIKKPDDEKIRAAMELGLVPKEQIEDCQITSFTKALVVKKVT